jgi:prepilin-type N-terminal cleavage/methylation domain-containing protein
MKNDLKIKFLQHLNQNKQNEGFTLIELLVVIIIIGILSAIALPSFLNQANKAKESEAKQYNGSINRAQQAYYLEKQDFVGVTTEMGRLGLGIKTQTANYKYSLHGKASDNTSVGSIGKSTKGTAGTVRSYIGGVQVGLVKDTSEATTLAVLCQGEKAPAAKGPFPADPTEGVKFVVGDGPECTGQYEDLGQ